jgi:hypothetical protein
MQPCLVALVVAPCLKHRHRHRHRAWEVAAGAMVGAGVTVAVGAVGDAS